MDFSYTPEETAFREEFRKFLKEINADKFPTRAGELGYGFGGWSAEFCKEAGKRGYIGMTWPKEYGGKGLPPIYLVIAFQEGASFGAQMEGFFYTEAVGASIATYGSDALKKKFLPLAAKGEISFYEGLSEPEAGTDLLNMKTKARQDGDNWIIDGQKVWQSNGAFSTHGIVACITDPAGKRGRNISCFIVDSKTPGVTIRPIKEMTGEETFVEVFLDGVKVPGENLVGKLNNGFSQVMETLIWDRFWARLQKGNFCEYVLNEIVQFAKATKVGGKTLAEDPVVRNKIAQMYVEIEASRALYDRAIALLKAGQDITIASCMGKFFADEMGQRFFTSAVDIIGIYGQLTPKDKWAPLKGKLAHLYFGSFGLSLAGGSSEVQRTTIAGRGLGLVG
jgi:alkylation response protein AidB-like acyl-CoA dehydrogenase